MNCTTCGSGLVSRLELSNGTCVPCAIVSASHEKELRASLASKQEELDSCSARLQNAESSLARQLRFLEIENDGRIAHQRGLGMSENPHETDDERLMWANGWSQEETLDQLGRTMALLKWVGDSLDVIHELCDEPELRGKLAFVLEKVNERLGELT